MHLNNNEYEYEYRVHTESDQGCIPCAPVEWQHQRCVHQLLALPKGELHWLMYVCTYVRTYIRTYIQETLTHRLDLSNTVLKVSLEEHCPQPLPVAWDGAHLCWEERTYVTCGVCGSCECGIMCIL